MTTRGSTTARGYGSEHQKLRATGSRLVASGNAVCWRCGRADPAMDGWDLGHDD